MSNTEIETIKTAIDRLTDVVAGRSMQPGTRTGINSTRRKNGTRMIKYPVPFSAAIRGFREMTEYEDSKLTVRSILDPIWVPQRRLVELTLLKPYEPERREEGRELFVVDADRLYSVDRKATNWDSRELYDKIIGDIEQPILPGPIMRERSPAYIETFATKISRVAFAAIPGPINNPISGSPEV